MSDPLSRLFGGRRPCFLIAGDIILDRYVWGEVERISPEAPVQVLHWRDEDEALGGAANVAANLAALDCEVRLMGLVGEDEHGERLGALLRKSGIDGRFVRCISEWPTIHKTRFIARSQHILRVDREGKGPLPPHAAEDLTHTLPEALAGVDGIICSDYLKGALSPLLLKAIFAAAVARGIPVVVDPKGRDYSRYKGAKALTPNLAEVALASGMSVGKTADLEQAMRRLFGQVQSDFILVTRGSGGMTLFGKEGVIRHEPARALEVYDVTGAGDTATALFTLALFGGTPPEEAVRLANLAAGIVVGKVGTATVERAELTDAWAGRRAASSEKILSLPDLVSRLKLERAKGRKIAFTNGCFDLLHVGHIQYLQQARRQGDILVVGLNDDDSVRRLKGVGRPLIGGRQRAELLGALESVDFVVFFSQDTPDHLIRHIRPDSLIKGGDYTPEEVVGKEMVESYGGKVLVLPFVEGFSTTNIVDTILERYAPPREKQ